MKLSLFLISLFFLNSLTYAGPHTDDVSGGASNSNGVVSSKPFSLDAIGKFKGQAIDQDAYAEKAWNYLAPNEHFNHLFEACLPKEGGAYISVGTFRGVNVASSGKVSHLVLMDIDSSAVIFNKINLQLISKAKDRFQYLSYLFTGKEQPDLESKAKKGEISASDFFNSLYKLSQNAELEKSWKETLKVELSKEDWERLNKNLNGGNAGVHKLSGLMVQMASEFRSFDHHKTLDKTIMGNDTRFKKIQDMIADGKVTVMAGSVAGDKSMRSLGDILRKDGLKVAAVDVSNVPDYLQPDQQKKTIENVRSLPMREKGRLIYTGGNSTGGDGWGYHAVNQDHLSGLDNFYYGSTTSGITTSYSVAGRKKHDLNVDPSNESGKKILFSSDDLPCDNK